MKNLALLFVVSLVVTLTGCASVPMASLDLDAKAKDFAPLPNKGSVFIYRNESFGAAIPVAVSVNGRTLGQTASMTYFRLNIKPGRYIVSSHAENVSEVGLDVETGKSYFVWQEMKMGLWTARTNLQQVDEDKGRAGVSESKLIASSISERDIEATVSAAASNTPSLPTGDLTASKKLRELQDLKREGVITDEEFEAKKKQLIDKL
jgi:hypothetical protein